MDFPQRTGHCIHLTSTADTDSVQSDSGSLNAAAKQRADFLHRMIEAARHVGRDLGLLQHPAVVINHPERQFRSSDVNCSDHAFSLSRKRVPRPE
jgi:hypothetical protein